MTPAPGRSRSRPADLSGSVYDVVVVGAGSAGAAVAARLSEEPDRRVLLLEAGPDWRPREAPPELRGRDWTAICDPVRFPQFLWTGQVARRTPAQQPELYWRGRGLGGSSSVNGTYAIRPPIDDFDRWPSDASFDWSADRALAGFVALEDDLDYGHAPHHGTGGPIPIERTPLDDWGPFDHGLRDAALARGHSWQPDCNAPGSTGIGHYPTNTREGRRVTTNDSYLEPARRRANLSVVGDALVSSVVLSTAGRATAVRVRVAGTELSVATGEVVVCAGAIQSPAILQRSGIGPHDLLSRLGIPTALDLPVGEGLQEHHAVAVGLRVEPGRCEATGGLPLGCILRLDSGAPGTSANDVTVVAMPPRPRWPIGGLALWLNEVFSTGTVRVCSPDPGVDPEVDLALASHPLDARRLAEGVELLRGLLAATEFGFLRRRLGAGGRPVGADGVEVPTGTDQVATWVQEHVHEGAHAASTCAMGAVVDASGRVLGTEGLRVVDVSVAPRVPRANTHLPAVMLAECLADPGRRTPLTQGRTL